MVGILSVGAAKKIFEERLDSDGVISSIKCLKSVTTSSRQELTHR